MGGRTVIIGDALEMMGADTIPTGADTVTNGSDEATATVAAAVVATGTVRTPRSRKSRHSSTKLSRFASPKMVRLCSKRYLTQQDCASMAVTVASVCEGGRSNVGEKRSAIRSSDSDDDESTCRNNVKR